MSNILTDKDIEKINTIIPNGIKANYELNLFIAKKDKIDYIYNTSALEGNAMTYPEVETLLEGISVGGHKLCDEQMILNQNRSVNLLFLLLKEKQFDLSKNTFLKLHNEVAKEEALKWGIFRDANVRIGGTEYLPPDFSDLSEVFLANEKQLQKINNPINRGITFFLLGARNQYFFDGNKRTSRLMMNGELLSNGYSLLNIKAKDKLEFNTTMLNFYNSNDIVKPLVFLLNYYQKQNAELNSKNNEVPETKERNETSKPRRNRRR